MIKKSYLYLCLFFSIIANSLCIFNLYAQDFSADVASIYKYTKQLEDRFAEIQIKQQQATEEDSEEVPNKLELSFLDDINLKLIRFVAQKRSSSDGNKLGFGSPLNTSTYTLGFVGVGGTTTTLLEEDF